MATKSRSSVRRSAAKATALSPNIRSAWSGQIVLGPVTFDVTIKKMFQADPQSDGLKRLCSCCHEPFSQDTACPAGKRPWSAAAEKRGVDTATMTPIVHGILTADDKYVVLDEDVLAQIDDATALHEIDIEEVVPVAGEATPDGFPMHLANESYFVAPHKDIEGAADDFAVLVESLARTGSVAVAQWSPRATRRIIGLHVVDGMLMATIVPYAPEVRAPDEQTVKHQSLKVDEADVTAVIGALDALGSTAFDHDAYVNESIPLRRKEIDKALKAAKAGRKVTIRKAAAEKRKDARGGSLADRLKAGAAPKATRKKVAKPAAPVVRKGRR